MNRMPRGPAWSAAWGVAAVVSIGIAVPTWLEAVAPGSKFPLWPALIFSVITTFTIYMCFASLRRRRPTGQKKSSEKPQNTVNVELIFEQAENRLRLGVMNHGSADEFSAQVTSITDPMGRTTGLQHWLIPWLEDESTEPKRIFAGQTRMLIFARYDDIAVDAELSTGQDGTYHWWFFSVPAPIGARYYNLRCRDDLEEQHFTLTVRIMSASSDKFLERRLKIGLRGSKPTGELVPRQHA